MLFKFDGKEQTYAEIDVTRLEHDQRTGDLVKGYRDYGIPADVLSGLTYRRDASRGRLSAFIRGRKFLQNSESGKDSNCI